MIEIIGTYQGKSEVIDTAKDQKEVSYLVGEYRLAFGSAWTIKTRRKR